MNPPKSQSDSARQTYFDPEAPDSSQDWEVDRSDEWSGSSEEQFSASLGLTTTTGRPEFVLDPNSAEGPHLELEPELTVQASAYAAKEPDRIDARLDEQESAAPAPYPSGDEQSESDWRD